MIDLAIAAVVTAGALGIVWSAWTYAVLSSRAKPTRRPLVYIAAPFAPCDGVDSAEHTRRALVVAALYRRRGFEVVCVHPDILAGRYGDDENPTERAAGAARTLALCVDVARRGGRLAAVQKPDGGLSSGTCTEAATFVDIAGFDRVDAWRWNATTNAPERIA